IEAFTGDTEGRIIGKKITSSMISCSVKIIDMRSMPGPMPVVGGMPYSDLNRGIHWGHRGTHHREEDHVVNDLLLGEDHRHALDAGANAGGRGHAVFRSKSRHSLGTPRDASSGRRSRRQ